MTILLACLVAAVMLTCGISAASRALGRRDELNFPVSPLPSGGGGSVARTLSGQSSE